MAMMANSPSQGMDSTSVAILSILLPVAVIGGLSSQHTTTMARLSTQVSGQVIGCPQIFVEEVPAILMVHISVSQTFAFPAPSSKVQSPKNVQGHSLLLHPRQVLHLHLHLHLGLLATAVGCSSRAVEAVMGPFVTNSAAAHATAVGCSSGAAEPVMGQFVSNSVADIGWPTTAQKCLCEIWMRRN